MDSHSSAASTLKKMSKKIPDSVPVFLDDGQPSSSLLALHDTRDIELLPDTGYQLFRFPLIPAKADNLAHVLAALKAQLPQALDKTLAEAGIAYFKGKSDLLKQNEWVQHTPWLRTKFARWVEQESIEVFGYLVAVETNLGNHERGAQTIQEEIHKDDPRVPQKAGPSAYAAPDVTLLTSGEYPCTVGTLGNLWITASLKMVWIQSGGKPIPVDLTIDFGNSRTVVLANEYREGGPPFNQTCRPIPFLNPQEPAIADIQAGAALSESMIPPSWFVLHEPMFNKTVADSWRIEFKEVVEKGWLGSKTVKSPDKLVRRRPHAFVAQSPVVMGPEAARLLEHTEANQGRCSMSSPKRYLWDTAPVEQADWTMIHDPAHALPPGAHPRLACEVLEYLPADDRPWTLATGAPKSWAVELRPKGEPQHPDYCRAQMMTLSGLNILENAHRHVNSANWRGNFHKNLTRYIRKVQLTFPSGWTREEVDSLKRRWNEALDIFADTRLRNARPTGEGGERPELVIGHAQTVDESVAAQLPVIYSEIHRMGDIGENWLGLVGRRDAGAASETVRAMSIDIGGGTTDLAVVEYADTKPGVGISMETRLLFRDSLSVAGDTMVKRMIEKVVIPSFFNVDAEAMGKIKAYFSDLAGIENDIRPRVALLAWMPIIKTWLSAMAKNDWPDGGWSPRECGVFEETFDKFNDDLRRHGLPELPFDQKVNPDPAALEEVVKDTFGPHVESWAAIASAFHCDLVIVAGKPSEMSILETLLREALPLPMSRVVFCKNYHAGDWYPMSRNGRITDAKTVTAVGAALSQAIRGAHSVKNWFIKSKPFPPDIGRNQWGFPGQDGHPMSVFMERHQDVATGVGILVGAQRIGRQFIAGVGQPEPVYEICWKNPKKMQGRDPHLTLTLRRNADDNGDRLVLEDAVDGEGRSMMNEVELKLNTLPHETHWLDSGRFEV